MYHIYSPYVAFALLVTSVMYTTSVVTGGARGVLLKSKVPSSFVYDEIVGGWYVIS